MKKEKTIEFIKAARQILELDLDVAVEVLYYARYRQKIKKESTKALIKSLRPKNG